MNQSAKPVVDPVEVGDELPPSSRRRGAFLLGFAILPVAIIVALIIWAPWKSNRDIEQAIQDQSKDTTTPTDSNSQPITKVGSFELLETVKHDTTAFTQGLLMVQMDNGERLLYEGTGMKGASELRLLDLQGNVLGQHKLSDQYFGEGIAHFPGSNNNNISSPFGLLQITWKEHTAFEYRLPTTITRDGGTLVSIPAPFHWWKFQTTRNEGWGITYDPSSHVFFVSDGSQWLHVWDADSRQELSKIRVQVRMSASQPLQDLSSLNELEYDQVTNTVLANVWGQNFIARIHPTTGFVEHIYDCSTLYPQKERPWGTDVFNGIALTYDLLRETEDNAGKDEVWVTGA